MKDFLGFIRRGFDGSKRSQRGWAQAGAAALSSLIGKSAANQAQKGAEQPYNNALAQDAQQGNHLRKWLQHQQQSVNPFEQAAGGMNPYFAAAGTDTGSFSPQNIAGMQTSPVVGNPSFRAPAPQQMTPQMVAPNQASPGGWGVNLLPQTRMQQ